MDSFCPCLRRIILFMKLIILYGNPDVVQPNHLPGLRPGVWSRPWGRRILAEFALKTEDLVEPLAVRGACE